METNPYLLGTIKTQHSVKTQKKRGKAFEVYA